jgi:hypothetical protein
MTRIKTLSTLAAAIALAGGTAYAQTTTETPTYGTPPTSQSSEAQPGRVAVDITSVRADVADRMGQTDATQLPATVWLPPGQAAQACGISASDLVPSQGAAVPACSATEASPALVAAVRNELDTTTSPSDSTAPSDSGTTRDTPPQPQQ